MLGKLKDSSEDKKDIIIGGIAVFKDNKLIGTLSNDETIPYLIITNKLKECNISMENPFINNSYIDYHISDFSNSKTKVTLENGKPHISTTANLKVILLSNSNDFNTSNDDDMNKLKQAIEKDIENLINSYYEKTIDEFESDIAGLGKNLVKIFPNISEWENYNWREKYKDSTYESHVNVVIESSYFIS